MFLNLIKILLQQVYKILFLAATEVAGGLYWGDMAGLHLHDDEQHLFVVLNIVLIFYTTTPAAFDFLRVFL